MSGTRDGSTTAPTSDELRSAGLAFSVDGPVAEIVLCAPERRNTQTPAMWRALAALGRSMPDEVRIVVVRAEGPSFSAGLDRSMLSDGVEVETVRGLLDSTDLAAARLIGEYQQGFTFLRDPNFVSIAAVQGHAVGGGFQLALACDIRVVADDVTFCMKEPALGLVPDLTGLRPLVRQVGYARALELCVRARNIDATEAVTLGIAQSGVPVGELTSEVDALVRSVLQSDTDAVRETKRLLQSAENLDLEQQRTLESAAQVRRLRALAAGQADSDKPRF
ncbi:enoyl-CoA hydratase/isomerase family protein [Mycobacterium sp. URHB0044]|uniref:enoyl-CoA hydratase/isomerase family protein n=1 Tax=Mycobacterium sp. URHB0044 TaxID=1380386 RepID=UPI00048B4863|nr:enoyl-CoA hydratase/isomerase family protein [Mycobacterium sp. URHB0044]